MSTNNPSSFPAHQAITAAVSGIVDSMDIIFPIEDNKRILEGEVESLTEKLEIMSEKYRVSKHNFRNVKLTLISVKNECKALTKENKEKLGEITKIEEKNRGFVKAAKKDQQMLSNCEVEITENKQELRRREDDLRAKEEVVSGHKRQIAELGAVAHSLHNHLAETKKANEKLNKEHTEAIEKKNAELTESREMQRELSHQYRAYENENAKLREEVGDLQKEKQEFLLSKQVLEEEIARLRQIVFKKPTSSKKRKCFWCN